MGWRTDEDIAVINNDEVSSNNIFTPLEIRLATMYARGVIDTAKCSMPSYDSWHSLAQYGHAIDLHIEYIGMGKWSVYMYREVLRPRSDERSCGEDFWDTDTEQEIRLL